MGCDIHYVVERRKVSGGPWVGLYSSDQLPGGRPMIGQRDYGFFAEVAGVRGSPSDKGHYPRNLPEDISELAWTEYMRAPRDHHSPSHLDVKEFCGAWLNVNSKRDAPFRKDARPEFIVHDLLGLREYGDYDPPRHEWRVVFWFDN